jgi:hypothetical protein
MIPVLISISISTIIVVALLLWTRRRLTPQFRNLDHRLMEVERLTALLKKGHDPDSTTAAQLQRLHMGLMRVQENMARRYGALAPLAKEASRRGADAQRHLTELQLSALQQWAGLLGVPLGAEQIEQLVRTLARAEALEADDIPLGTCDLSARVIALLGSGARDFTVAVAGSSTGSMALLLQRIASGFFDRLEILRIPTGEQNFPQTPPLDALILDEGIPAPEIQSSLFHLVRNDGLLVSSTGPDRAAESFPGFELVAAEWSTAVYRKREAHGHSSERLNG